MSCFQGWALLLEKHFQQLGFFIDLSYGLSLSKLNSNLLFLTTA